ncbi:autophagy protein [Coemansia sp. RSA 2610]|nr:autophagy protein [Coemansia sp. RSA 2610]
MSKAVTERCKRCSRQLDFVGPEWDRLADDDIDGLLQTLPGERSDELRAVLGADAGGGIDPHELSRFFNNSFRTDQVTRQSNGAIARASEPRRPAGGMRGSLALVRDRADEHIKDGHGLPASEPIGGAQLAADSLGSQSESFILLSSSQIQPSVLGAELARMSLSGGQREDVGDEADRQPAARTPEGDGPGDDVSTTFTAIGRLMDRLGSRSAVGHPLCEDCGELMLRLLDRELGDSVRERQILEGVGQMAAGQAAAGDVAEMEREIARQTDLEHALRETLGELDAQLDALCGQLGELDAQARAHDATRAQQRRAHNEADAVVERGEAEQWALDEQYARLAAQLTQLQRTNVYNDVFTVAVSEGVGSINGFRLGGRATHGVEWAEINTAWGQALLLLQTVARRLSYEFVGYRLIPMGSFSRIERLGGSGGEKGEALELFGSGDMYLGRLFQNRRFDAAMVAYLACLDQVAQLIMSLGAQLRVPYPIEQDRVGAVSIRPQFGQDDVWTRACRNTLMDARWALAFASSYEP